ncbi:hypothetical protein CALVIDRAFT_563078 [Calocera viscosa TUFC12733]|uniref:Uncharacterized protein n=1 Tax=Calocera viscosa (strain TUFC12733) TaxID=1330018 RepID=A0A167N2M7_CALVF|nr:hypothetical protein CALVIDRAFT_563078 [Calocera viscosa TUFC12733]
MFHPRGSHQPIAGPFGNTIPSNSMLPRIRRLSRRKASHISSSRGSSTTIISISGTSPHIKGIFDRRTGVNNTTVQRLSRLSRRWRNLTIIISSSRLSEESIDRKNFVSCHLFLCIWRPVSSRWPGILSHNSSSPHSKGIIDSKTIVSSTITVLPRISRV